MVSALAAAVIALVIGHPTPIACAEIGATAAGLYHWDTGLIELDRAQVCDPLGWPQPTRYRWTFSFAAFAVVHEAEHAAGALDEHEASCRAIGDLPRVLRRVGLSAAVVAALMPYARFTQERMLGAYGGACASR